MTMRQHAQGRGVPRVGLAFLALVSAVTGAWALGAPASFFATFPAPGHPWVALLPPYKAQCYGSCSQVQSKVR